MDHQKIIDSVLKEARIKTSFVIKTKYDDLYRDMINKVRRLPWNEKPRQGKQSALNSIDGNIGKYEVSFQWHSPSTEWGPAWNFLELLIFEGLKSKVLFDKTHKMVEKSTENIGLRGIDFINFAKNDKFDDKAQKDNLKEFNDAIEYAAKLKK